MKSSAHVAAWLFTGALLVALILPKALMEGMFMDGEIYAVVAHNMAQGLGSFWQPIFTDTLYNPFYEHPPLAMGLLAWGYRTFGDSPLIEGAYTALSALATLLAIRWTWKQSVGKGENSWIPVLLWGISPVVFWAYTNNLLENTMSIWTTLAVGLLLRGESAEAEKRWKWIIGAAVTLLCAFLTKGFTGLFPLCVPFFYWLIFRKISFPKMMLNSLVLGAMLLLLLGILCAISPQAWEFLVGYFQRQVVRSLNEVQTVDSRWFILRRTASELLPAIALTALAWGVGKTKPSSVAQKYALLFVCIGISGTLPIVISLKQSAFYALAAYPMFALGFACLSVEILEKVFTSISPTKTRIFSIFFGVMLAGSFAYSLSRIGVADRDAPMQAMAKNLSRVIPPHTRVGVCKSIWGDWQLHAYLMRYGNISITDDTDTPYFLQFSVECPPTSFGFRELPLRIANVRIYRCQP